MKTIKLTCSLCKQPRKLFPIYMARPLEKGLCCRFCWGTMVIPARTLLSQVSSKVQRKMLLEDLRKRNDEMAEKGVEARKKRW